MSDIRDLIDFDTPYPYAELLARGGAAREAAHCTLCGLDSPALEPQHLTLVKYRQSGAPKGASRLYCTLHLEEWRDQSRASRRPGRRGAEPPAAQICASCYVQMPLTGRCLTCD